MGIIYRFRQFWTAWTSPLSTDDLLEAREILSPVLMELFMQMQPSDQAHSLKAFRTLRNNGEVSSDLLRAALLHDVGKCRRPLNPWERAEVVLFQRISPKLVKRWGDSSPSGWKKPFVVFTSHAEWGAAMVEAAGGSSLLVNLIRRHHDPITAGQPKEEGCADHPQDLEEAMLLRLQKIDNES